MGQGRLTRLIQWSAGMVAGQRLPFAPWRSCLHRRKMSTCAIYNPRLSRSPPRDVRHPPQSRRWSQYCPPCFSVCTPILSCRVRSRDLLSSTVDPSRNFFLCFKRAEARTGQTKHDYFLQQGRSNLQHLTIVCWCLSAADQEGLRGADCL